MTALPTARREPQVVSKHGIASVMNTAAGRPEVGDLINVASATQDFIDEMLYVGGGCIHCDVVEHEHRAGCPVGKLQDFLSTNWEELS